MPIFGSDGFRSEFGENFMTPNFICKFANSIADYVKAKGLVQPVLIARDTRVSGIIVEDIISGILCYRGLKVVLCGVLPTPGLSCVLKLGDYSLGIMITASHNPFFDNGIKLFNSQGFKLSTSADDEIERGILGFDNKYHLGDLEPSIKTQIYPQKIYSNYVLGKFSSIKLKQSLLLDCSNGAFSEIIIDSLGKRENIHLVETQPNGLNINLNCGALEGERLLKLVRNGNHQFGAAFDGDGDRCIFVSADYGVIETEKIMLLIYQLLHGRKDSNVVVTTEICNLAFAHNLEQLGVELIETEVGDRNVTDQVRSANALFGAEPSGHYYFPALGNSMDGFLALMHFIQIINQFGLDFNKMLLKICHYERITKNICIKNNELNNLRELKQKLLCQIDPSEEKLIIRQSIWEPVLRVYYDYKNINRFSALEQIILTELSK